MRSRRALPELLHRAIGAAKGRYIFPGLASSHEHDHPQNFRLGLRGPGESPPASLRDANCSPSPPKRLLGGCRARKMAGACLQVPQLCAHHSCLSARVPAANWYGRGETALAELQRRTIFRAPHTGHPSTKAPQTPGTTLGQTWPFSAKSISSTSDVHKREYLSSAFVYSL